MKLNFLNYDSNIVSSDLCLYDSNIGYYADFSINGHVDNWTYYDGIHTYGCWNNFLFGTLYGDYALIGRYYNIEPIDGELYYIITLSMLIKPAYRTEDQALPAVAKIMWVTLEDNQWDEDKSVYFDINCDSNWHTYTIDLAYKQKWVGNISNLRIYPIYTKGRDGDEFFIKTIQIASNNTYLCKQIACSYYNSYLHPCLGVGSKPYCESSFVDTQSLSVEEGYSDFLIININGYGAEAIKITGFGKIKPKNLAKKLTTAIGSYSIGGYSEAVVLFTDLGRFRLYGGTATLDSSVVIEYSPLAELMGFFREGLPIFYYSGGSNPASLYKPTSAFSITPAQLIDLVDGDTKSYIEFDPSLYRVEGGRSDWSLSGLGVGNISVINTDESSLVRRSYPTIGGPNKTLIDFSHPFNASGRINQVHICGTSDYGFEPTIGPDGGLYSNGEWGVGRLYTTGVKVKIFRPRNNGSLEVVADILLPDRDAPTNVLTSDRQEHAETSCDVFVNKGDLIGVYNISLYYGRTLGVNIIDASYYELTGDPPVGAVIDPGELKGEGNAGLLIYAHSDQKQNKIELQIDLKNNINIKDIVVKGDCTNTSVEYNIMRCVDFAWEVDLFGEAHATQFRHALDSGNIYRYTVNNIAYGVDRLNDGVYTTNGGRAADSFIMNNSSVGVIPINPYYFFVNGDNEWLTTHYWPEFWRDYANVDGFELDPIAFTVRFPYNKDKTIHKFRVHFKEYWNFRSFALSTYMGPLYQDGDADNPNFMLIPEYTAVLLDGRIFTKDSVDYNAVDKYLFTNPSIGHPLVKLTGGPGFEYPGDPIWPGESTYTEYGTVTNIEQLNQSKFLDWRLLEHHWSPVSCKGFRFYCLNHQSTKIFEMELFGYIDSGASSIVSDVTIKVASIDDNYSSCEVSEDTSGDIFCVVNRSIRYISISLSPINTFYLNSVEAELTEDSVFFGPKGCEDTVIMEDSSSNKLNSSQPIFIKNTYADLITLRVDIVQPSYSDSRTLYYSTLDSEFSIKSPAVGPGAFYKKEDDYILVNTDYNVAINCDCYSLKNMVIDSIIYYSYNNGNTWLPFNNGASVSSDYINISNLSNVSCSIINIPILSKSRYWRVALKSASNFLVIRELLAYRGEELITVIPYHDRSANVSFTPASRSAKHLINSSITGSYYTIDDSSFITLELSDINYIDRIVLYHDALPDYTNNTMDRFFCGVDKFTLLYIRTNNSLIHDYSYFERPILSYNVNITTNQQTSISKSSMFDFGNDPTSIYPWNHSGSTLSSFNYVTPSGVLVDGIYEHQGYLACVFEYSTYGESALYTRLPVESDIYMYQYGSVNTGFEIEIRLKLKSLYRSSSYQGVSFGFINRYKYYSGIKFDTYVGAGFSIGNNSITLYVQEASLNNNVENVSNVTLLDGTYYKFNYSFDGDGTYSLKVTKDYNTSPTIILEDSLTSNISWSADAFGIAGEPIDDDSYCHFDLYYMGVSGTLYQDDTLYGKWGGGASFTGADDSYLMVPYTEDFNFGQKRFSIDFFIKVDEFPYGASDVSDSGMDIHTYGVSFYSGGKFGWYGAFNNSSYLLIRNNSLLYLGSDDFTIDFLVTFTGSSTSCSIFYRRESINVFYNFSNNTLNCTLYSGGSPNIYYAYFYIEYGEQYHVAISKVGTSLLFFVNGSFIGESILVSSYIDYPFYVVSNQPTYWDCFIGQGLVGRLEELRVTKGISRWSEFFTPPATPYTSDPHTILICRFGRDYAILAENFDDTASTSSVYRAWSLRLLHYKDRHTIGFYYNNTYKIFDIVTGGWGSSIFPAYVKFKKHLWYHIFLSRGYLSNSETRLDLQVNGIGISNTGSSNLTTSINPGYNNIVLGKYLCGSLNNIRISCTATNLFSDQEGVRIRCYSSSDINNSYYDTPWEGFDRLYSYLIYSSYDNVSFGLHAIIDLYKESIYSYFDVRNIFGLKYSTMVAIDLHNRYALSIVRSYGSVSPALFDIGTNVIYSNIDSSSPYDIFTPHTNIIDHFVGEDYSVVLENWDIVDVPYTYAHIKSNSLVIGTEAGATDTIEAQIMFKYTLYKSFTIEFGYGILEGSFYPWSFEVCFTNFSDSAQSFKVERGIIDGIDKYKISVKDGWYSTYYTIVESIDVGAQHFVKISNFGLTFYVYIREHESVAWRVIATYNIKTNYWEYTNIELKLYSPTPMVPEVSVYIKEWIVTGVAYYSTSKDARWVTVALLNGDGVSRTISNIGIYTDIHTITSPSGFVKNNIWLSNNNLLTSYESDINIAYGATVSGSSQIDILPMSNIVDGDKQSYWGSGYNDSSPYVIINLGTSYDIYRIKLHFGENVEDINYIIKNYTVSYSIDDVSYTTLATVIGNTFTERTHDANPYITAKYVKLSISSFVSHNVSMYDPGSDKYIDFDGVMVREIEIYKYSGGVFSSESTPIIALNLGEQYYLGTNHEVIGVDYENKSQWDWTTELSNFCYSDSVLTTPEKVVFKNWGVAPTYEKWVVIKKDTATNYNNGPHYMRKLIIRSDSEYAPTYNSKWWSSYSGLTKSTYSYNSMGRALEIGPIGDGQVESISFISGDHFGIDTSCSFRDSFSFNMYISDPDSIDYSYGNIHFGGVDSTQARRPVIYKWNFTSLSGSLISGLNDISLCFNYADSIEYSKVNTYRELSEDTRNVKRIDFNKVGILFKTLYSKSITIAISDLRIRRNYFNELMPTNNGLYLTDRDYLSIPISDIKLSACSISFWLKTDYNLNGVDIYGNFSVRNILSLINPSNDTFGLYIGNGGFNFYAGNINDCMYTFKVGEAVPSTSREYTVHIGISISNDGTGIDSDGSTIRLYINNNLYARIFDKWPNCDSKNFKVVFGGKNVFAASSSTHQLYSSMDATISNLRICSYCRTDFSMDMGTLYLNTPVAMAAEDLIEVSIDNVTFYRVGAPELPLVYTDVPYLSDSIVYIRSNLTNFNSNSIRTRTAELLVQWDLPTG